VLRVIALLLVLTAPAFGADLPFAPCDLYPAAGPRTAQGALVWLPGTYGADQPGPPPPPDIVARLARPGLDVFQFLRARHDDPLDRGARILAQGLKQLRAQGYRRIVVAGHSRGGWIALTATSESGLADAIVAISPAAHGTSPQRQAQARADWQALWAAANAPDTSVVLVQLRDDPYDPDPAWRLRIAETGRVRLKSIYLPPDPIGHVGAYMPAFDHRLGATIADIVLTIRPSRFTAGRDKETAP